MHNTMEMELIGLYVEIVDSRNKIMIGLKGKIIDETRNTLIIEHNDKTKEIVKDGVKMKVYLDGKAFDVDGKLLIGRPEDRIKK